MHRGGDFEQIQSPRTEISKVESHRLFVCVPAVRVSVRSVFSWDGTTEPSPQTRKFLEWTPLTSPPVIARSFAVTAAPPSLYQCSRIWPVLLAPPCCDFCDHSKRPQGFPCKAGPILSPQHSDADLSASCRADDNYTKTVVYSLANTGPDSWTYEKVK